MSDLISKNKLLRIFCISKEGKRIPEFDCDNFPTLITIKEVKDIIRGQPTICNIKNKTVCQWKQDGDNLITDCGDYFNLYDNCTEKFNYCPKCGKKITVVEQMKDNMLVFNDNETHTEISYVIARFEKSRWYHYLDFPNIEDAKEHLEKVRKIHPNMKLGIFEKIEQATINMLDEEFI